MELSLPELDALSATLVMEWKRTTNGWGHGKRVYRRFAQWTPTTNWQHTQKMLVAVEKQGWQYSHYGLTMSTEASITKSDGSRYTASAGTLELATVLAILLAYGGNVPTWIPAHLSRGRAKIRNRAGGIG